MKKHVLSVNLDLSIIAGLPFTSQVWIGEINGSLTRAITQSKKWRSITCDVFTGISLEW